MTFDEFIANEDARWREYQDQCATLAITPINRGKFFFNCLNHVSQPVADKLRKSLNDPFYNDNLLESAIHFIKGIWYEINQDE